MNTPRYLERRDVPKYYPLSLRSVDKLIATKAIPVGYLGRKPIIRSDDMDAYLDTLIVANQKPRRGRPTKAQQIAARKKVAA